MLYIAIKILCLFIIVLEAQFEFTQNMYIGSEGVNSPPDIPFAIRLTSGSAVLSQPVTVTVMSEDGSAFGKIYQQ